MFRYGVLDKYCLNEGYMHLFYMKLSVEINNLFSEPPLLA